MIRCINLVHPRGVSREIRPLAVLAAANNPLRHLAYSKLTHLTQPRQAPRHRQQDALQRHGPITGQDLAAGDAAGGAACSMQAMPINNHHVIDLCCSWLLVTFATHPDS